MRQEQKFKLVNFKKREHSNTQVKMGILKRNRMGECTMDLRDSR